MHDSFKILFVDHIVLVDDVATTMLGWFFYLASICKHWSCVSLANFAQ